jgi:tetratricopeptide (TPR) repeat protein
MAGTDSSVFEQLRAKAQEAVDAGRLEDAEALVERALAWAETHGSQRDVDLALCGRAAVLIPQGRGESELPCLREVLMRNSEPLHCHLAAYHISIHYYLVKNFKKSLFYARIACDRAEVIGVPEWLAAAFNQIGNALLAESHIQEASGEYEKALALYPADLPAYGSAIARGVVLDNLGYCRVLQKRFAEGYRLLYSSLLDFRRHGLERLAVLPHLDLAFAHLETGRLRHARNHALKGLKLAEANELSDSVKNALYLLGEAESLRGDVGAAQGYFQRLQIEYFPDAPYLTSFLLAVDVRKLVNLHA